VRPNNVPLGIALMVVAMFLFPVMNASVKHLAVLYALPLIMLGRYGGHLALFIIGFAPSRGLALVRTKEPRLQLVRSVLMLISTVCYFITLEKVPLTTVAAISMTSPLMVTALSVPLLGERVGIHRWGAVILGFVGALIVVHPSDAAIGLQAAPAFLSSASYALYQILTRRVGAQDTPETSIMWTAIVGFAAAVVSFPFFFELPKSDFDAGLLVGIGVVGGLAHYLVVRAITYAPAPVLAPFGYGQLLGAAVLSAVVFEEFPDAWTWTGIGLIVASGLYIVHREAAARRAAAR